MAFRQNGNKHDRWLRFCDLYQTELSAIGLPERIVYGEEGFRDLLRDGTAAVCGVKVSLTDLSAEQWVALERFTTVFFHEWESYAPLELFPAFRREVERRGIGFRFRG